MKISSLFNSDKFLNQTHSIHDYYIINLKAIHMFSTHIKKNEYIINLVQRLKF